MVQDVQRPTEAPDIEEESRIATSPLLPPLSFQLPLTAPTNQGPTRSQFAPRFYTSKSPQHPPMHRKVPLGTRIVDIKH